MIDKLNAPKIAKLFVEKKQFLTNKLGRSFKRELLLYEFGGENPDPVICEAINQYLSAEWHLRRFLQENSVITGVSDHQVRVELEALAKKNVDETDDWDSIDDERLLELEDTLLSDWRSPKEWVLDFLKAQPLISVSQLPVRLQELVIEARKCYAFCQPNAVIALGRMILEFAISDIWDRVGKFEAPESDDFHSDYKPNKLANFVLGATGPLRKKYRDLYNTGCDVIHSSENHSDGKTDALSYLRDVLEFVADRYAAHSNILT